MGGKVGREGTYNKGGEMERKRHDDGSITEAYTAFEVCMISMLMRGCPRSTTDSWSRDYMPGVMSIKKLAAQDKDVIAMVKGE
jgi:hypothetical protein